MEDYNCLSRIKQEFQDLMNDPIAAIGTTVGMPDKNNPYEWRCTMMGPSDTSFRNGLFYLKIIFPRIILKMHQKYFSLHLYIMLMLIT